MAVKHFNNKIVLSGNILEMYQYENTYYFDIDTRDKSKPVAGGEKKDANKTKALNRAIKEVRRFIASNYAKNTTKFVTLGFKEEVTTLLDGKKRLEQFHRRLKRKLNVSPKYVGTYEYQCNGKIHFHIIYFNLPYIEYEELLILWKNGSVYIESVEYGAASYNYLTRYILKANINRLDNENMYFRSLNLIKPIIKNNDLIAEQIKNRLNNTKYEWFYQYKNYNEYSGEYIVKSIDISNLDYLTKKKIIDLLI